MILNTNQHLIGTISYPKKTTVTNTKKDKTLKNTVAWTIKKKINTQINLREPNQHEPKYLPRVLKKFGKGQSRAVSRGKISLKIGLVYHH